MRTLYVGKSNIILEEFWHNLKKKKKKKKKNIYIYNNNNNLVLHGRTFYPGTQYMEMY
jgi:hypothetical protein